MLLRIPHVLGTNTTLQPYGIPLPLFSPEGARVHRFYPCISTTYTHRAILCLLCSVAPAKGMENITQKEACHKRMTYNWRPVA